MIIGDKVIVVDTGLIESEYVGRVGIIGEIDYDDHCLPYKVIYTDCNRGDFDWFAQEELFLL